MQTKFKSHLLALGLALAMLGSTASAQDLTVSWNPRSGDVWVDTYLSDINRYGGRYREPFVDELVRYHGAPRPLVLDLLDRRHWAPGDIYYACSIASIIGRPCRYVVDEWDRDRGQGWGVVAKRLGIKPGSAEFHRLKKGFVPSYDRWGRPIDIDTDLHNDLPGRGKGGKHVSGAAKPHASGNAHASGKGKSTSHGNGKSQGGPPASKGSNKGKSSKGKGGGKP